MLGLGNGQLPEALVLTTLVSYMWDSKQFFYTLYLRLSFTLLSDIKTEH